MHVLLIVFAAAIIVQLIYFITFLVAFPRVAETGQPSEVPVSVVVCAHDEEENLKQLIPLLLDQQYENFEVVIVDDRSNDSTFDFLLAETRQHPRLRMVHVNNLPDHVDGKKYALTLGIKAAHYDWILLTDADCRPIGKNWLSGMSRHFHDPHQVVLGFSPYLHRPGLLNLFIRFEALLTAIQYLSLAVLKNPYMGVGRNMAYRKSFFLSAKGFHNILHVTGGDDDLFVNQHATGENTDVCIHAETKVLSEPKITWQAFFHQKIRHLSVGKKYQFRHRVLLGLFMLSWMLTWLTGGSLLLAAGVTWWYWIIGALTLRSLALLSLFYSSTTRLKEKFELWAVPFLDFLFSIYYISTGLVALFTKKIQWKK